MKTHLSVFALSAILIASMGMAPAFGQIQDAITVTTDKQVYAPGEIVMVTGEVRDLYSGTPISIIVIAPNKNIAQVAQISVGADKTFSTEVITSAEMKEGTYTVKAQYGTVNRSATATFEIDGDPVVPDKKEDKPVPVLPDNKLSIEGSDELIGYEITGGEITSIMPDFDAKSLIISINATDDGSLTLIIPRTVFDSVDENGNDDEIFVLIDGEEGEFVETMTSTDRTITIEFPVDAEQIEIIGTFVVPEFGTIAAMILAVAIISIVAVSAKSRLSIMPRY